MKILWHFLFCSIFLMCDISLCAQTKILGFGGSSRNGSFNNHILDAAVSLAEERGAVVTKIDFKNYPMPFYNADLEMKEGQPLHARRFRELMLASEIIFIASPEYNGSLPAELKNAIDWASRDERGLPSRDAFKGKKFLIMSASPGGTGGAQALEHLRMILTRLGGEVYPKEFSVPNVRVPFRVEDNPSLQSALAECVGQVCPKRTK